MTNIKSLIHKKVKLSQPGVLQVFYPEFTFFNEKYSNNPTELRQAIFSSKVIFFGNSPKYIKIIDNNITNKELIHVTDKNTTNIDIDLDVKTKMLQFIYNSNNKSFKHERKYNKRSIFDLADDQYYRFIKNFWITGDSTFCLNIKKGVNDKIEEILNYLLVDPEKASDILTELTSKTIDEQYYYYLEYQITLLLMDAVKGKKYSKDFRIKSINNYENKLDKFKEKFTNSEIKNILVEHRKTVSSLKHSNIESALLKLILLFVK